MGVVPLLVIADKVAQSTHSEYTLGSPCTCRSYSRVYSYLYIPGMIIILCGVIFHTEYERPTNKSPLCQQDNEVFMLLTI